jgi:glycogen synthase
VLNNCLKVDFWDIDEMVNQILSVLNYPTLRKHLAREGHEEVLSFDWRDAAAECLQLYRRLGA